MKRPEQELQIALCNVLNVALPGDCVFFAVPNGGWRTKVEAAILKAMGVKAGIPDLAFVYEGRTLFIEMKSQRGHLTDDQRLMAFKLKAAGATVQTAKSIDEALAHIRAFGIRLRIKDEVRRAA